MKEILIIGIIILSASSYSLNKKNKELQIINNDLNYRNDLCQSDLDTCDNSLSDSNDTITDLNNQIEDAQSYTWTSYEEMGHALDDLQPIY